MNIRTLKPEELSHHFSECVKRRSELEGQYFLLDENRKILLDKLTMKFAEDMAHGKALSMARTSPEFKVHVEGQAIAKQALYQARGDLAECDFEIKRRLNLSFSQNMQRKADGMNT
jgi:hypothetical protein